MDEGFFRVSSSDACTASPIIKLGAFALANGEIVRMTQSRKQGVTLAGVAGRKHINHYKVGRGENVLTAIDGSGNVASVSCDVPILRRP